MTLHDCDETLAASETFCARHCWQISDAEADIEENIFITPDSTSNFSRIPFKIKNFGATLVRGIGKIVGGLDNVDSFTDHLIVHMDYQKTHS